MAGGGGKSKERREEMGVNVKNYETGVGVNADVGTFLQDGGPSRLDLWLGDVCGEPSHWKESGGLPPQGGLSTYR